MTVLGVSSIYMYPKSFIKSIHKAVELGFRHINIFAYPPHFKEDSEDYIKKAHKVLFNYGLDCSLKIQGYTINIAATNPNLRKKSVDETLYWINVAGDLECTSVIMRAGMFFYSERVFKEQSYRILAENFAKILDTANDRGLRILIENYPYPFDIIVMPSDILRLSKILKKRLNLILNIPHLYDVYKSRRINIDRELKLVQPCLKMAYIGEYMNPWDHPHKLDSNAESYEKFLVDVLKKIRPITGVFVIIGYNEDDVIKMKNLIMKSVVL